MISTLLNYLYPSQCPACGKAADSMETDPFCRLCWSAISRYSGPSCDRCGVAFASAYAHTCAQCLKEPPAFSRALSFGLYDNVLAMAINHYKFHGLKRLYKPLGRLLLDLGIPAMDAAVPVPLSIKGLRERGFNQALLLCRVISKSTKIPMVMDGLVKIRETKPQVGLSAKERADNLKKAFGAKRDFKGLSVLLVDDVMTTGATVNECAKQLLKAGAKDVKAVTLARANIL